MNNIWENVHIPAKQNPLSVRKGGQTVITNTTIKKDFIALNVNRVFYHRGKC